MVQHEIAGPPVDPVDRLISEGNALEDSGRFVDALQRYDAALNIRPNLPRAHLNRGNALLALNHTAAAVEAYRAALQHDPDYAPAHFNLGNAYLRTERLEEAMAEYRTALLLKPQFVDAEVALGALYADLGRRDDAIACFRRALKIAPDYVAVHVNLATALERTGKLEEAVVSFRSAVELAPGAIDAQLALGNALSRLGRHEDAAGCFRAVLERNPASVVAHANLGNALHELGRLDEAVASHRNAVSIAPQLADAHYNLGRTLDAAGRASEGAEAYRAALAIDPRHVLAHYMLGNILKADGHYEEAIACYQRVLALDPKHANAHYALGNTYGHLARMNEAIGSYRAAVDADPSFTAAYSNLLFIHNYLADRDPAALLADAVLYGDIVARAARPFAQWSGAPDPDRPIRVGWVSGDLRAHPVGFFLVDVLAEMARRSKGRFEFHTYSNHAAFDDVSARIAASCSSWHRIVEMDDASVARRIHGHGIDILVDLSGHTALNRLPVFAWKPAPVQVTWLGYFATTGVRAIDYLIADPLTLPPTEEAYFTENIWRLPETRLCFSDPGIDITPGVLPAQQCGTVTFCSFNDLGKINDGVIAVWARLLARVAGSRLLVKAKQLQSAPMRNSLARRFRAAGVPDHQLIIEAPSTRADYLAAYRRVDMALDPFPYPGGTTTVEALWMGVPVLTLNGTSFLSRQGVGLLTNAGLEDWIAANQDDYVTRAAAHAQDLGRLASLRSGLRQRVLRSPIFDAPRFAANLETALRDMWRRHCGQGASATGS